MNSYNNGMLRRYTDLPGLLCMLTKRKITLLDPCFWDDKNDAYYIELYNKRKNLGSTLALCLTQKNETYHHWSVFTSRENGVCVVFDRDKMEDFLAVQAGIVHGPVKYMTLSKMEKETPQIEMLPFLKRHAFTDESEYRIVYSSNEKINFKDIPLPIDLIQKISVNPWAPDELFNAIKTTIRMLDGCKKIKVKKSLLINNKKWCSIGDTIP